MRYLSNCITSRVLLALLLSIFTASTNVFAAETEADVTMMFEGTVDETGDISAIKRRSFCLGIYLYLPNPWGGWGWWCLGRFV